MHVYEVRPRRDHRGVDLISDALPFGRLWYGNPNAASKSKLSTPDPKLYRRAIQPSALVNFPGLLK
jgi:hypothetical protein